jgi:threonine aldolase
MSNLAAILSHSDKRGSEIIVGSRSHLCIYEGGNVSHHGGVHSRQITENPDSTLPIDEVLTAIRGDDPHYPRTSLVCIENTHNIMGGVPLEKQYIDDLKLAINDVPLHIDGARIFNASIALKTPVAALCHSADSVSICLSKGLGAPIGSVLVGSSELIRKALRIRKSLGGGMRQSGVVAAAGLYALENNVERLAEDHERCAFLCDSLIAAGYHVPKRSVTNLTFFGLPLQSKVKDVDELTRRLKDECGVLIGSGYGDGTMCRAALHKMITDEDVEKAAAAMTNILA